MPSAVDKKFGFADGKKTVSLYAAFCIRGIPACCLNRLSGSKKGRAFVQP
jgi:hypothetical protein